MATFPIWTDTMCSPGEAAHAAPGIDWLSPYRWVNEQPSNAAAHDHIVRTANAWLRASAFTWFVPVAEAHGVMIYSDGREVTICVPGAGAPARITRITLGLITGTACEALTPTGGLLQ